MTSKLTRERLEKIKSWRETYGAGSNVMLPAEEAEELACLALAAMDNSESVELPLDYLQGHKDGLEWAAQLAEANHPETGDWLYDDPIELAKAIRKGPDMPPSQPALDTKPVAYTDERNLGYIDRGRETAYLWGKQNSEASDVELYRHAQPVPVVPKEMTAGIAVMHWEGGRGSIESFVAGYNFCRAAMLAAAPQLPGSEPATVPGKWIPVSERMPESNKFVLVSNGVWVGQGLYDDSEHLESDEHWQDEHREFINVLHHPVTHWMPLPAAPQKPKP